jgi:hypothetical protein
MNEFDYTEKDKLYTPENEDAYARTSTPMEINFPNYIFRSKCVPSNQLDDKI